MSYWEARTQDGLGFASHKVQAKFRSYFNRATGFIELKENFFSGPLTTLGVDKSAVV